MAGDVSFKSSGFVAASTAAQRPVTVMAGCVKMFSDFTLTNIETESLATQPASSESYKGFI